MMLMVNSFSISIFLLPIFHPFLTLHSRHSEDGVDFNIFILSLSFLYYLLSLFIIDLQNYT